MRLLFLAFALSGCVTVADLREEAPFAEAKTQLSAAIIQDCLAKQWDARSGTVSHTPRQQGFSMSLNYKVGSNNLPAAVVDVTDNGTERLVKVFAIKGGRSKLSREIAACT